MKRLEILECECKFSLTDIPGQQIFMQNFEGLTEDELWSFLDFSAKLKLGIKPSLGEIATELNKYIPGHLFKYYKTLVAAAAPEIAANLTPQALNSDNLTMVGPSLIQRIFNIGDTSKVALALAGMENSVRDYVLQNLSRTNKADIIELLPIMQGKTEAEKAYALYELLESLWQFIKSNGYV